MEESSSRVPETKDDDLSDLPQELLAELTDRMVKGLVDPLMQLVNDHGGIATIDELLIDSAESTVKSAKGS